MTKFCEYMQTYEVSKGYQWTKSLGPPSLKEFNVFSKKCAYFWVKFLVF